MAPFATIYGYQPNPRVFMVYLDVPSHAYPFTDVPHQALVAAKLNGLELKLASEAPDFTMGVTNKSDEFLTKFPLGKVPALETHGADPFYVTESVAIGYFVADSGAARTQLLGADVRERAKVQEWLLRAEADIMPAVVKGTRPARGNGRPGFTLTEKETADAKNEFHRQLKFIEHELASREWLAGTNAFSLADEAVAFFEVPDVSCRSEEFEVSG